MTKNNEMLKNNEIMVLPNNGKQYEKSSNLYLNMYKYVTIDINQKARNGSYKIKSLLDNNIEQKVCDNKKQYKQFRWYKSNTTEQELLNQIHNQMNLITSAYKKENVVKFNFEVESRIIIGNSGGNYGNASIIALHPTYCIPYIPSSAIKGAFRRYVIYTKYNGDENIALKSESFVKVFGSSNNSHEDKDNGNRGQVIFLDAFPKDKFIIEKDVQTVHYAKYYEGKSEPTDDLNRIPINMYTVGKTVFVIGAVLGDDLFDQNQKVAFEDYFKETFTEFGIGAKTSIGYGLGNIIS